VVELATAVVGDIDRVDAVLDRQRRPNRIEREPAPSEM